MASDDQSKQGSTSKAEDQAGKNGSAQGKSAGDAVQLLKSDHREVEKLFAEHEKAGTRTRKKAIIEQITQALKIHAEIEEKIFYPAVRQKADAEDKLDEAQVEHDTMKILIADLEQGGGGEYRDAKVKVLSEYVKHHVEEEEASSGILEQGRKAGLDLAKLGQQMLERKQELQADPDQIRSEPVSLQGAMMQGRGMSEERGGMSRGRSGMAERRGGMERERDEEGRFMSERGSGERQRWMRSRDGGDMRRSSRYEDQDRERYASSARGRDDDDRRRDSRDGGRYEGGRYDERRDDDRRSRAQDEEDERYSRSSRGRGRRDDDDGRSRSGWFGDSRGHAEAARRGWDHRH